jgi:transcriptional regulator with XRE-family HTH domain
MGRIERGEHTPLLPQVMKIARALGMRPGELLDETEKMLNQTQNRK